jgi:branched-chain amino acid transport system substrate-binding protein
MRVGVVLPETGAAAVYGTSIKSGVKLAFDAVIANGEVPGGLDVSYRDSGSDPTRAASAASALFEDGAVLVIGGATSSEAKAMVAVSGSGGRVLLSPSASAPDLARHEGVFFRVYPSDEIEGTAAADFFISDRRARRVFVLQEDNDYTRGLLPVFVSELQAHGGWIVASVEIGAQGLEAQIRQALARHNVDGVYVCGYGDAIVAALRVLRNLGYRGTICTTSAVNAALLMQHWATVLEGVYFPLVSFDATSQREPVVSFVRRYHEVYNLAPDVYAAHGYDAVLATLAALRGLRQHSGSTIRDELLGLRGVAGVFGKLEFDGDGNIRRSLAMHTVRGGRVSVVEPARANDQAREKAQAKP